ncbi:D-alanine--D-alanine ligase family protein [Desulfovibrio ferrophilus]|uniref:D-alanine--D-alanine ligase n=1 Tax=Desulfovibrio ferrophilus TaxID=241368 RepID=A0A2Z6AXK0_9BACT|nr:D-alanine--D-alanine ligase [Desulfovibrio ferrophilus]BBD07992.1 D-alanine--D-alanine ligase [Desulfovibrio ferrophilus]
MRILLIAGGWSTEREVSLSGARGIRAALKNLGHEVMDFDPSTDLGELFTKARQCDFAFINLHGSPGEDGLFQAMLETVNCPYQGSNPTASFLALNKAASKAVFRDLNLPTPDWEFLPTPPGNDWAPQLEYPLFAKPNLGGSSLGMTLVNGPEDLQDALKTIYDMGEEALLEAYIKGIEITCGVLDDTALAPILICPKDGASFFDYASKYIAGKCDEICPAPIPDSLTKSIQDITLKAHRCLKLSGYSRADFMVVGNAPYLLEINTLPGMTPTSLIPQEAAEAGYSFEDLIAKLIELGMSRSQA